MLNLTAKPSPTPKATSRFINTYYAYLSELSIAEDHKQDYLNYAIEFSHHYKGRRIRSVTPTEISHYLDKIRQQQLSAEQYKRCINALRILLCDMFKSTHGKAIEWHRWLQEPRQPSSSAEKNRLNIRLDDGPLQAVRTKHHALLARFITEVRRHRLPSPTEQNYEQWLCRFIHFRKGEAPHGASSNDIKAFLEHLSEDENMSSHCKNQALSALAFLYQHVLKNEPHEQELKAHEQARPASTQETDQDHSEVKARLLTNEGPLKLLNALIHNVGLHLNEALQLRIDDIDFTQRRIHIHGTTTEPHRYLPLPNTLFDDLHQQCIDVEWLHRQDIAVGYGNVVHPDHQHPEIARINQHLKWQFLFPSPSLSVDAISGKVVRTHLNDEAVQQLTQPTIAQEALINSG